MYLRLCYLYADSTSGIFDCKYKTIVHSTLHSFNLFSSPLRLPEAKRDQFHSEAKGKADVLPGTVP